MGLHYLRWDGKETGKTFDLALALIGERIRKELWFLKEDARVLNHVWNSTRSSFYSIDNNNFKFFFHLFLPGCYFCFSELSNQCICIKKTG
ncbi:hypothetical protein A6M23_18835 [Acidithiobacillus thiooxidans]|uniref:Uncharacterized protein n=1 Tax=Acidithiobacillus thiooxidans TaxID=930 RepID=A0A1C2HWX6_ACITH|nr:hypothetical protein A6M23_18835 [Acidithiobacillus thiooxidans]OCX82299.1 hypothetical protein A6P08_12275 [Acidithiobacillus thiooxidans]